MRAFRGFPARVGLASALLLTGCAFSEGGYFAEVAATLEAKIVVAPGRELAGGWHRLNTDFAVRFTRAEVVIDEVALQDLGGSEALAFDPAHPPPGYSLCHGGHCHRDDGALVSYEDIAAELSGGSSAGQTVAALPVGLADLLAPSRRLLACEPSCGLPRVHLGRARMGLSSVVLEGVARDERQPPRFAAEVPFVLHLNLPDGGSDALAIDAPLDIPTGRDELPGIKLAMTFVATARLFDDVPFDALGASGGLIDLDLDTPAGAGARDTVQRNLAESELSAEVTRHDEL